MSGFAPKGASNSQASYAAKRNGGNNFYQRPVDRLVTIIGWDNVDRGVVLCKEDDTGKEIEVKVSAKDIARNVESAKKRGDSATPQRWAGYLIDERMKENLPVGTKIVLERSVILRKDGAKRIAECSRIIHVTDPSPNKIIKGLYTIGAYDNRVQNIQAWNQKAISIDDDVTLTQIAKTLDDNYNAYLNKENRPNLGVMFRTIVPKDLEPGQSEEERVYEVMDNSPPLEWISAVKDEAGELVTPGHPITGNDFQNWAFDYQDYVFGAQDGSTPALFSKEVLEKAVVEVMVFTSYLASHMSTSLAIPEREYDPLYKMSHTPTKNSLNDTDYVLGKNIAVYGILQLSSDKVNRATQTFLPRDLAVRLYSNGHMGNLQNCVRTSTGNKTKVNPGLEYPKELDVAKTAAPTATAHVTPVAAQVSAAPAPVATPAPAAVSRVDVEEPDPFAALMGVTTAPAQPTEPVVAQETVPVKEDAPARTFQRKKS